MNIKLPPRLAALPVALLLCAPLPCTPAHGQSLSVQKVQRALGVLRLKPNLASQACLDKLEDLHKMEKSSMKRVRTRITPTCRWRMTS
ncbi:hypothetical protein [Komagataeibacter kakiaceti]|uniref:hypothetical protein n=1 Tax=Komagataeibacter kakiaceti TaxID=943261 RepID=UPI000ADB24BB|nr:hypothetical protein [Komagataeibacter kakiaceti]